MPTTTLTRTVEVGPLRLESGAVLPAVRVAYRTWGRPRPEAVLVCHALTGSADADGWWGELFAPGRLLDPARAFVVATNVLGGCYGTTGPTSPGPDGRPWGDRFPAVTIRDMVAVQARALERLGVRRVRLVIGGSMGGMQALEWAVARPLPVERAVAVGAGVAQSAWAVAVSDAQRAALDAAADPATGLAVARMVAMWTYRSPTGLEGRFARRPGGTAPFAVQEWLRHHGRALVERFDPATYRTLVDAMDSHDLRRGRAPSVLAGCRTPVLAVGISSDVLYPPHEVAEVARTLPRARYVQLESPHGHDAFLIDVAGLDEVVRAAG